MRGIRGWLIIEWYKILKNRLSLQALFLHVIFRVLQRQIADRPTVTFCLLPNPMNCLDMEVAISKAGITCKKQPGS